MPDTGLIRAWSVFMEDYPVVDGVPLGVQIIGQRFREDLCLDAARAIEMAVGVLAHQLWAQG